MNTRALPTLDVVIPCYNEEVELAACLELLLSQAQDIQHIIVVDNNSSDASPQILADYAKKSHQIIVRNEKNQGVEYARNTGIAAATADVVARIDVDARVEPGWALAIRRCYGDDPDVAAATGATEYYDLPFRGLTNAMTWFFMTVSNEMIAGSVNLYGANMSIRRTAWSEIIGTLPPRGAGVMEDLSISLALEKLGKKIAYIPDAKALVSGRRIRTTPRKFARYNAQWPNTYVVMGYPRKARLVRAVSYFGNVLQTFSAFGLQYHDPVTGRFNFTKKVTPYEKRELP